MELVIESHEPEETEKIAEKIGGRLKGGEVIELSSDLGGGKTTFVRGLARGAGSGDVVSSPTFTVSKVYKAPKFEIHHFDFYRLHDAGLITHELEDLLNDPTIVIVSEWSGIVETVLPEKRLRIEIQPISDTAREIIIRGSQELGYLLESEVK